MSLTIYNAYERIEVDEHKNKKAVSTNASLSEGLFYTVRNRMTSEVFGGDAAMVRILVAREFPQLHMDPIDTMGRQAMRSLEIGYLTVEWIRFVPFNKEEVSPQFPMYFCLNDRDYVLYPDNPHYALVRSQQELSDLQDTYRGLKVLWPVARPWVYAKFSIFHKPFTGVFESSTDI